MERSNQLHIRVEEQPPDDWLVVRGGPLQFLSTLAAGQRAIARFGVPLLSVVVTASARLNHELRRPPLVRYRRVRTCTVQQLTYAGYVLLPTFRAPHFSVQLPALDDLTIGRLVATLSHEMENPYAKQ